MIADETRGLGWCLLLLFGSKGQATAECANARRIAAPRKIKSLRKHQRTPPGQRCQRVVAGFVGGFGKDDVGATLARNFATT